MLFSLFSLSFGAQKKPSVKLSPPCYEKEGMQRASYIRSYISKFKDSASRISLSQNQLDQLDEILEISTGTCIKLSSDIELAEESLEELLSNMDEKSDKKLIIEKVKKVYSLKAKLELAHFQLLGKAEKLLTDEQKTKLKEIPHPPLQ